MRLWSLHPCYLDAKGLAALWREALLAQKVLAGAAQGYQRHPQLARFRTHPVPVSAISAYLHGVYREACRRGYRFDRNRIIDLDCGAPAIEVTDGQLRYELSHLAGKLRIRDPDAFERLSHVRLPRPHPSFIVIRGPLASWERPSASTRRDPEGPSLPG